MQRQLVQPPHQPEHLLPCHHQGTTLASGGGYNTTIGNSTGTLTLTSSTGLNVTATGAATGIQYLDTITTSATGFGFVGAGSITSGAGSNLTFTSGTTGAVSLDSGTSGTVNIGTGNTAKSINLGTGSGGDTISIGVGGGSPSTTTLAGSVIANTFASSGVTITGGRINSTSIGAGTPSTGAFTTLSSTQGKPFHQRAGSNTVIGNATGTLQLTSSQRFKLVSRRTT